MITLVIIAALAVLLVVTYFSCNNREIALRKEAEAQKEKIESVHDAMWKIIKQKADVSDQYREAFEKIYPELISGRYSGDNGNMMKWIQEQNPNFDTTLYKDLMQAIEVQRVRFDNAQQRAVDIIKQREAYIEKMPARFFITNKSKIEYEVISSTRSKTVMETRIDDETEMFNK